MVVAPPRLLKQPSAGLLEQRIPLYCIDEFDNSISVAPSPPSPAAGLSLVIFR